MNRFGLLVLILLIAKISGAAEGAEEAANEVITFDAHTQKVVFYQLINFSIMVGGLVYFLKKPIKKFFVDKKATYVAAAEKTKHIVAEAEQAKSELEVRLSKLESTATESLRRAKEEAEALKTQMLSQAQALSKHLRTEAAKAAEQEIEKAKREIRQELIKQSFALAGEGMEKKVSSADHARLQSEFISNIQAVQR